MQKVLFEFGDGQGVYANSGFGFREFNNAVLNEFKILQVCEKNALAKGCIAEYKGLNVKDCSGFNETNIYENSKMSHLRYVSNACLNQGNPPPVKGGLDDFKNIDKW